jgi:hypothetical protein
MSLNEDATDLARKQPETASSGSKASGSGYRPDDPDAPDPVTNDQDDMIDDQGRTFDPDLHFGPEDNPRLTSSGHLWKKSGGKKTDSTVGDVDGEDQAADPAGPSDQEIHEQAKQTVAAADKIAEMIPGFEPEMDESLETNMVNGTATLYRNYGIVFGPIVRFVVPWLIWIKSGINSDDLRAWFADDVDADPQEVAATDPEKVEDEDTEDETDEPTDSLGVR